MSRMVHIPPRLTLDPLSGRVVKVRELRTHLFEWTFTAYGLIPKLDRSREVGFSKCGNLPDYAHKPISDNGTYQEVRLICH